MSKYDKAHFGIIRFVHETLYGVFVDPYDWLRATGLSAGQKVLEVGCGPGFFTIPAAEMVGERGRVYAIDNNPAAVDYMKRKILRQGVTNVDVMLVDASRTGMPDGFFDTIFLFGVVHALWNQIDAVTAEAHRILRTRGVLSISKSPVPESKIIDAVSGAGKFRFMQKTSRVMNFEKLQETESP